MESDTHTNCLARVLQRSFLVKGVLHLARGLWLCELFATTGGGQAEIIIASLKSLFMRASVPFRSVGRT